MQGVNPAPPPMPTVDVPLSMEGVTPSPPPVTIMDVPLSRAIPAAIFGAVISAAGLYVCTSVWRRRLIRKQLLGTDGISEATATVTSKHTRSYTGRAKDLGTGQWRTTTSTVYLVSYNFTAKINGQDSQVYVDDRIVSSNFSLSSEYAWARLPSRGPATVRFLEREPRRNVLKDAAEMDDFQTFLYFFTICIASIVILVGAVLGLGLIDSDNWPPAHYFSAARACTYVILISAVLVFVYRALWMKVHAVICCLSGVKYCTEFNNVNVTVPAELGADGASALA